MVWLWNRKNVSNVNQFEQQKLFTMEVILAQNQLMLINSPADYGIEAKQKVEVDNASI